MSKHEGPIVMAQRYVRQGEAHAQKMRNRIDVLTSRNRDASDVKELLALVRTALAMHRIHLAAMLKDQAAGKRDEDGNRLPVK